MDTGSELGNRQPVTLASAEATASGSQEAGARTCRTDRGSWRLAGVLLLLIVLFAKPLFHLVRLALHEELASHILLIPFISAYLIWLKVKGRGQRSEGRGQRSEDRGQRSAVSGQPGKAEVRGQRSEVRGQSGKDSGQRSIVTRAIPAAFDAAAREPLADERSEDSGQRAEVRGQRSAVSRETTEVSLSSVASAKEEGQPARAPALSLSDGPVPSSSRGPVPSSSRECTGSQGFLHGGIWTVAGLVALGYYWLVFAAKRGLPANDSLAPVLFAFVCFLIAGVTWVAGWGKTRALLFPLVFLFFMVPLPTVVVNGMETFLQRASASAADMLFSLSGTTYFRDGQVFVLPGLSIRVGQECSGIRSSFVLFMTSLLAAYMFLRRPWSRVLLAFSVIPLGIVRNGFRVFTIAMLTAHVDQGIIDSPLHHRGGPLFFALSLIPFFGLLWLLRAVERKKVTTQLGNRE